jgi:hypothetical protein
MIMQKNYWDILRVNKLCVWAVFLFFITWISSLYAQSSPTISWQTDTTKIRLGEQINLSIEVSAPRKDIVAFPEIKPSTDSIEVLGHGEIDTSYKKERATYKTTYRITSFDEGKYRIPPIQVKAGEDVLTTDPFEIEVLTVPVDTLQQARYGIKDIRTDRYTFVEVLQKYWWIPVALLVLALIIWEIIRLVRRERIKRMAPELLLSPYERAKFRLNRLDESGYIEKDMVKEYYVGLTDVIRLYLDEEFDMPAPESTSSEILAEIKKLHLTHEQYYQMREFLTDADLVKFAKMFPSPDDNKRYRLFIEAIIDTLRPVQAEESLTQKPKEDDTE